MGERASGSRNLIVLLSIIISLFGLAGNASVIWFLGFRMHRNAFYIYILNLAAADFLLLCLYVTTYLIEFIKNILNIHIVSYSIIQMGPGPARSKQKPLTRLCVTILLTALVFFCGLPFRVCLFLLIRIQKYIITNSFLFLSSLVLSSVNSSANPIIYFFFGFFRQQFQARNLKLVLERALQDTPEEGECGGSLPQGTLEMSGSRVEQG
ncbi:mas-related G-protein coupled receptor member X3-like [Sciurus carolinensis]|uniref:mas-related G-protein coupled receptor member X3-like n=1 Tax=Sciurus carolinensis TaxID=30640 RepID=UPI001FB2439A|nr:mas-related G-protein coupled receptor member X3-like [Sciurus carolinensis]